ncbi:dynein regulatory complex subunit 7 isoform X1 [Paramormyrops kingsleyae]|uniref:dynein regulatory complex subunit 7 isoform X1 n=2 Tax=Paramormyrops kingsleyae TaxID=1676925 RepID=UPI003B96A1B8
MEDQQKERILEAEEEDDQGSERSVVEELQELEETHPEADASSAHSPLWVRALQPDPLCCPASYKKHSPQERHLLKMAHNFHCQYAHLYPIRKHLLLYPLNECGVQKFVSTTLQPTLLPYPELYTWDGCSSLVSDFLALLPLDPPFDLPTHLYSPTWVLKTRRGSCFDFTTLLCSLLLGAGYDAYCVSGYAVKETCLLNQSCQECPLLVIQDKEKMSEQKTPLKKYSVKPRRDLSSRFREQQQSQRQAGVQAAVAGRQQDEQRLQESERPPVDRFIGHWVHCWVLVLSGSREVPENFFIDPLTGRSYPTTDKRFLGVESIWNHQNYWVNIQECRSGCVEMTFDLGNAVKWESLLCCLPVQPQLLLPDPKDPEDEYSDEEEEDLKVFEMPPSWVKRIEISQQDMEMRCPTGVKVIQYHKAKLEKVAPYLLKDGLVIRLTTYKDLDCTESDTVKEWFQHRQDYLEERELNRITNVTLERFGPGRSQALKTHRCAMLLQGMEHDMEFYSHSRVDGLAKRVERPTEITESFEGRTDFLYHRHIIFGKAPGPGGTTSGEQCPILKVVERFGRDCSKPAGEDVAERVFLTAEGLIRVTYHLEDDHIIPAQRSFAKFQEWPPSQRQQVFSPDMVSTFLVDPSEKPCTNQSLYNMLVSLMKEEDRVTQEIRSSSKEVRDILALRKKEESNCELRISIYSTAWSDEARRYREELERVANEERLWKERKGVDELAPLLAKLGNPEHLTREEAEQLRKECLASLKEQLVYRANLIQERFQKETQQLRLKQQWYQQNQLSMTQEEKEAYMSYCSGAVLRIKALKLRLGRHKDYAPQKYLMLDEKLRRDPRLSKHLC